MRHLDILQKGVKEWNAWRRENPDVMPDLTRADLTEAGLYRADLAGADLAGADLAGANLAGANLAGANLAGADLAGADLAGAERHSGLPIDGRVDTGTSLGYFWLAYTSTGRIYVEIGCHRNRRTLRQWRRALPAFEREYNEADKAEGSRTVRALLDFIEAAFGKGVSL